jgi:hypothetical protein
MSRQLAQHLSTTARSDATLAPIPSARSSRGWNGELGHHRYYGSSACNGGEQIIETRRGPHVRSVNVCGF